MYRSALVVFNWSGTSDVVSQMTITLAASRRLQLTAIAVLDRAEITPPETESAGVVTTIRKARRDEMLMMKARNDAQRQLDDFARLCSDNGISCATLIREGSLEREIPFAVQSADMFVTGEGEACGEGEEVIPGLTNMLKNSSSPCLIAPCSVQEIERVAVAFDGSLQAARALRNFALSGLWQELPVDVLSVAESSTEAEETAARATAYLTLHEYAASAHPIRAEDHPASHILQFVREAGAGVLVMGAYGKPRWYDFFLGTVTRSVLEAATVPIFLSN